MKKLVLSLSLFILLIFSSEMAIKYYQNLNYNEVQRELNFIGNNLKRNIQKEIDMSVSAVTMNELFLKNNNYSTQKFENWGELILKNYSSIYNIQLAPNGIVKHIYPLKDNQKAIGHNLLKDPKRRLAAIEALKTGKISFIGPLKLIQNGKLAVIIRKPIEQVLNDKSQFWGFSTIIILLDDVIELVLKDFDTDKFNYALYGYNPDSKQLPILSSSKTLPSANRLQFEISMPNGSWTLFLESKDNYSNKYNILRVLFVLLSFISTIFVYKYFSFISNENSKFKLLLKNATDSIHIIDFNGNLVDFSSSFYKELGYTYEEIKNLTIFDFYTDLTKERFEEILNNLFEENSVFQTKYTKKNKKQIDVEISAKLINIDNHTYLYFSFRDITIRKQLENELKEANQNLEEKIKEAVKELNHSLEIIEKNVISSKTDLNGIITEVSERFCEISKYSKNELIGKNHNIIRHPDMSKELFKDLWETISSRKTWNGRIKNKTKDGQEYWVDTNISPLYDIENNHIGYYSYRIDITQEVINLQLKEKHTKELEQKVKEQLEEIRLKDLRMLDQAKMASMGEMMNNIAHQWRQPLNVISICSSNLKFNYDLGTMTKEDVNLDVNQILESCVYLSKTIETFSKYLNKNKQRTLCSIEDEILSAKYIIGPSLSSNIIDIIDEIDYTKETKSLMVENELSQVIMNILSNLEFAINENKEIEDNKWIKITSKTEDDKFIIMIEDNAGGIPVDIIDRVFEPYFTTKFKSQGTGLGLSMSYSIIKDSIGGEIYVKNTQNGAKFFIELPLHTK